MILISKILHIVILKMQTFAMLINIP